MRFLAIVFVSLLTAGALFVAGFALLHGIESPERETTTTDDTFAIPAALDSDIRPLDARDRRVQFGNAVDASAKRRVTLRGKVDVRGVERLILLALTQSGRVLAAAEPDTSGRYEFEPVTPGAYELRVLGARGVPLRTIGRVDIFADRTLDVTSGTPTKIRIDVTLAGKAVPKAFVILERDGRRVLSGSTNETGRLEADLEHSESSTNTAITWRVWVSGGRTTEEWRGQTTLTATESSLRLDLPSK